MATFRKRGKAWYAEVFKQGIRKGRSFDSKAEAVAWATQTEAEIIAGPKARAADKTFGDLLIEYSEKVSSKKRGALKEKVRIDSYVNGGKPKYGAPSPPEPITLIKLQDICAADFAEWRDRRLQNVSAASVLREWNLLSHACMVAVDEWGWLPENPMKGVRKPASPISRDRLISEHEIERLLFALGYEYDSPPETITARVGAAMLFAIETAMRAGEITDLDWDRVNLESKVARLNKVENGNIKTKNGHSRTVPLSPEAIRILKQLQTVKNQSNSVFQVSSASLDSLFRKAKAKAMIDDLHFHDTRHEAITRLAKKLDVLDLARMVGHRDLKQLLIYYNESAESLANKLA